MENLVNENIGAFTHTYPDGLLRVPTGGSSISSTDSLTINFVAASIKSTPIDLEINGVQSIELADALETLISNRFGEDH